MLLLPPSVILERKEEMVMKYSFEEKRQLVMRYQNGESVAHICAETGIARSTFYSWIKPFQTTLTESGPLVTPQEFVLLKRRVEKQEAVIQVLKMIDCTVSAPLKDKLVAMEALYGQFSVHTLCDAMEVSRGTFYNHILRNKRDEVWYVKRRATLSERIREIYEDSQQILGADKITAILVQQGERVSKKYVAGLMREMGLVSMSPTAKKDYRYLCEEKPKRNILNQNFSAQKMNQIWVSDITCFKLKGKHHYIAIIMDLFSRKIIAYKSSTSCSTRLITRAFKQAYAERHPTKGLIFHSDRGSQYTSQAFQQLLYSCDVEQSFSKSGRPHDNAVAEAFFASLKREELYRRNYRSIAELKQGLEDYIAFYNTKRPHRALNYKCPDEVEKVAVVQSVQQK